MALYSLAFCLRFLHGALGLASSSLGLVLSVRLLLPPEILPLVLQDFVERFCLALDVLESVLPAQQLPLTVLYLL